MLEIFCPDVTDGTFRKSNRKGVFIDLLSAPEKGEIALATCDANGECIIPLMILSERNGHISFRLCGDGAGVIHEKFGLTPPQTPVMDRLRMDDRVPI